MKNRILIAAAAALAVILVVGALSLLIAESSTVNEEYYIAHAERVRAIETSRDDLSTIIQGATSAFEEGRAAPSSIDTALQRLTDNNALLQDVAYMPRENALIGSRLVEYNAVLSLFIRNAQEFAVAQDLLADALRDMQEESPAIVKELRGFNLRIQSANTFTLALDIIEFATGQRQKDLNELAQRIDELAADPVVERQVPGRLDAFASSARLVLTQFSVSETVLDRLNNTRLADQLWSLSNAILDDNRRTVSRAERARLLLSICTVLLLAGIGIVVWRLQVSYRALNKSNEQLEKVNDSLEDRVTERTTELSGAISELKESQVQLVQAEKMSSLGELVAGISHEINTPLWYLMSNSTVIQERLETAEELCNIAVAMLDAVKAKESVKDAVSRGLIDMQKMLNDGLKDDLDEAKDLVQDNIEGLEELTELAQSLKDFSRLDRSKQGLFNVNDGLDKTLLIARNKLKNKSSVHKYYGEVPSIHCAPSQINQIFLNLITNAADAISEQGEIVIRTWEETGKVCVSVSDTGSGIPEDVMAKIRDPFFTTKEVGKGTGLGLSIVDQIVEAHDGELRIQSEVGKGTTVTVILPIGSAPQVDVDAHDSEAPVAIAEPEADQDFGGSVQLDAANDPTGNQPIEEPDPEPVSDIATV